MNSIGILDQHFTKGKFFNDPYPIYAELQQTAPIHWSNSWQAWVITRYDDVMECLRNPQKYSSAGRQMRLLEQLTVGEQAQLQSLKEHYMQGGIINVDPPTHTCLRKLIQKAFTPRAVNRLRENIQILVDELLDTAIELGKIDLIHDFAFTLPAVVIARMLGASAEDRDLFKGWSEQINAFLGTGRAQVDLALRSQSSLEEMKSYLSRLLIERQREPQDDLLSHLAHVEDEGDTLSDEELLATGVTLLIAGHETTTNLIGNGLLSLLRHPEQLQMLRNNLSLMPAAIEEMLRYDGPAHSLKRVTTEEVHMGKAIIPAGDLVYLVLGSANRDPAHFKNPHQFNIQRSSEELRHIAFGYGIHFCVGAPLARLEAEIAFTSLIQRVKHIQLDGTPQWKSNMSIRGLDTFPIHLLSEVN